MNTVTPVDELIQMTDLFKLEQNLQRQQIEERIKDAKRKNQQVLINSAILIMQTQMHMAVMAAFFGPPR